MNHITSSSSGVPTKPAEIVPQEVVAKDNWADNHKRKQPEDKTSANSGGCSGNASVELGPYESDGAGEGNRGHREEVGVGDQVAHKGGEAAQGSRSPERVSNLALVQE